MPKLTLKFVNLIRNLNPLSRISHSSGSHASLMHTIDYNAIAKEIIWLAKKFNYRFTHL